MTALSPRPKMGHRSISEQAPLFDPSTASSGGSMHLGSRLRGSKASSGSMLRTGSQLPFSPLLPLPPAPSEGELSHSYALSPQCTPKPVSDQSPAGSGYAIRVPAHLRLDAKGAQSTGMVRSYSLPVATQAQHEEHQRIFARNGGAGAGFASLSQTQTSLQQWHQQGISMTASTSMMAPPTPHSSMGSSPPSLRSTHRINTGKNHSSCSPTAKNRHLAGMSPPTVSSGKPGPPARAFAPRSPLSPISANLPTIHQQEVLTPTASLHQDHEIESLDRDFAHWSATSPRRRIHAPLIEEASEDDYFNLSRQDSESTGSSSADVSMASDLSDEATTPRASSPSHKQEFPSTQNKFDTWSNVLDFIHPDHLA